MKRTKISADLRYSISENLRENFLYTIFTPMRLATGSFIKSSTAIGDPNFEEVIVFISEHNAKGSTGFIINKLYHRSLNELEAFKYGIDFPLYEGGPVCSDKLYFIHQRPDLVTGGSRISGSLYLGGSFEQAVACINNKSLGSSDMKIFLGYCGWDPGQLEAEIEEGNWIITAQTTDTIFS